MIPHLRTEKEKARRRVQFEAIFSAGVRYVDERADPERNGGFIWLGGRWGREVVTGWRSRSPVITH